MEMIKKIVGKRNLEYFTLEGKRMRKVGRMKEREIRTRGTS